MPPKIKPAAKVQPTEDADLQIEVNETSESILAAGILPMFITSSTLKIFNITVGETVTKGNPKVMISKEELLKDIQMRLSISDFQPAKAPISVYPESELALYYDPEFKYGQNFYLIITLKAKKQLEKEVALEIAAEAQATVVAVKERVPWVCLGSDELVNEEKVKNNREKFTKRRRDYGIPQIFHDFEPKELSTNYAPYELEFPAEARMQVPISATPQTSTLVTQTPWYIPTHETLTRRNRKLNTSTQCEQQLMAQDEQFEILESEELATSLEKMIATVDTALYYNEAINIFTDDYELLGDEEITVDDGNQTNLLEFQSFTDTRYTRGKCISCVDWYTPIRGTIAISCVKSCTLNELIDEGPPIKPKTSLIVIWSFNDPINPQLLLEAPDDILCFKFNPKAPHIIAGGCVVLWDISVMEKLFKSDKEKATTSTQESVGRVNQDIPTIKFICVSPVEVSHKFPVTDITWLETCVDSPALHELDLSESFKQFISTSTDGTILVWDSRLKMRDVKNQTACDEAFLAKPFMRIPISAADSSFDYSLTKLCFAPTEPELVEKVEKDKAAEKDKAGEKGAQAVKAKGTKGRILGKFYGGSEEGDILYIDFSIEKLNDEKATFIEHAVGIHFGCISDIQRSPFFPDIILTVGAWGLHIWKEGNQPIPVLSYSQSSITLLSCAWSPTRPAVFYVTQSDGKLQTWDMIDTCYEPISLQTVSPISLSYIAVHYYPARQFTHNQFVSVGDDTGTLHVLEVPRNLCKPVKNEKSIMRSFLDLELKRLSFCQERKTVKRPVRIEAAPVDVSIAVKETTPVDGDAPAVVVEDPVEKEYNAVSMKLKDFLGISLAA